VEDDLVDKINAELVKQAISILELDNSDVADFDMAVEDMVERLTAIWYSGYEFGMEDRRNQGIELDLEEEVEL